MAELIFADAFADLPPAGPDQDWAAWLAGFARLFRTMMFGHRDGARILAEADLPLSTFFDGMELALDVLQHAGFGVREAAAGVVTVIHFVLGHAFQADAGPSTRQHRKSEKGQDAPTLALDGERCPRIAALVQSIDVLSPLTSHLSPLTSHLSPLTSHPPQLTLSLKRDCRCSWVACVPISRGAPRQRQQSVCLAVPRRARRIPRGPRRLVAVLICRQHR